MKIETNEENQPIFIPKSITITFESQEEVNFFYFLFNFSPICNIGLEYGIKSTVIRQKIKDLYNETGNFDDLKDKLLTQISKYSPKPIKES